MPVEARGPLEMESKAIVNCLIVGTRTKLGSFGKPASTVDSTALMKKGFHVAQVGLELIEGQG